MWGVVIKNRPPPGPGGELRRETIKNARDETGDTNGNASGNYVSKARNEITCFLCAGPSKESE